MPIKFNQLLVYTHKKTVTHKEKRVYQFIAAKIDAFKMRPIKKKRIMRHFKLFIENFLTI